MTKNRKILLDSETTGLTPRVDRIIEIAAIEIFDDEHMGKELHYYINPNMIIPIESTRINGIDNEKVKDSPTFSNLVQEITEFIGDSLIIAHNSEFDRKMINGELELLGRPTYGFESFIDTLVLAKKVFPNQRNNLDELSKRLKIDISERAAHHGALIDTRILGKVYTKLVSFLSFKDNLLQEDEELNENIKYVAKDFPKRDFPLSNDELTVHNEFLKKIKDSIWLKNMQ